MLEMMDNCGPEKRQAAQMLAGKHAVVALPLLH